MLLLSSFISSFYFVSVVFSLCVSALCFANCSIHKVYYYYLFTLSLLLLSGSYRSENDVTPSDDLDFRHHNYKEMRQVCFQTCVLPH